VKTKSQTKLKLCFCYIRFKTKAKAAEQFNGREAETAILLFGLSVTISLRGGGFRPRQFRRWAAIG
jgi:hypothetical protein